MDILAKKMAIISAILGLVVVLAVGLMAGVARDVLLIRGVVVFFTLMGVSMALFKLALKDRAHISEQDDEKKQ